MSPILAFFGIIFFGFGIFVGLGSMTHKGENVALFFGASGLLLLVLAAAN